MDDNEAEVDLAVSTSLLMSNGGNANPNQTTEDTSDQVLGSTEGQHMEENNDESNKIDVESNNEEELNENNKDDDDIETEIYQLEKIDSNEKIDIEIRSNEDNIGVDFEISKDHISPQPYLLPAKESDVDVDISTFESSISPVKTETQDFEENESSLSTDNKEEDVSIELQKPTPNNDMANNDVAINTPPSDNKEIEDLERPPSTSIGKIINVVCEDESDGKILSVKIVDATYKKPFLGGFRNKHNGKEFLNASSQTYPKKRIPKNVEVFCRDTQTVQKKSQMQQTTYDTSTQMTKPGCYVSDEGDVVRIPGQYVSAAEKEKIMLEKVIIIQCYWRRWLATQHVEKLKKDRDLRVEWELRESNRIASERVERLRQEFERRMKPRTKSDFDLLYAALEKWRQEEMDRIDNNHSGPERKAALIALLEQEAYLIQSIERHRLIADENNHTENVVNFLDKAAQPKFWRAYDGKKTEMNTKYTLRAQELRDLYSSLQMKYLNQDERLDVLLTLKHTVKEHDCKLTQELIELIDREADLLTRNVKTSNLEGLRQRISTLFLQYCKTPSFNPDVARLLKVPADNSTLRKDIYFCPSCNSYLPSTEFPLASNSRIVGRCKKCSKLDNSARLRHDFTKIRNILQHLRRSEEDQNDGSKIAFIIQDADLRYLIEKIWNSQSALSGVEDLYDLVFVRWNKYEHWSPWNCLLLTKEEASAHMKLDGVSEAYGRIFVGKIHHRHVVAKQYFSKLTKIATNMSKNSIPPSKVIVSNKVETAVM